MAVKATREEAGGCQDIPVGPLRLVCDSFWDSENGVVV